VLKSEEEQELLDKLYSYKGLHRLLNASTLNDEEFEALQKDVNKMIEWTVDGKFDGNIYNFIY
jgi:hypothetical protein